MSNYEIERNLMENDFQSFDSQKDLEDFLAWMLYKRFMSWKEGREEPLQPFEAEEVRAISKYAVQKYFMEIDLNRSVRQSIDLREICQNIMKDIHVDLSYEPDAKKIFGTEDFQYVIVGSTLLERYYV